MYTHTYTQTTLLVLERSVGIAKLNITNNIVAFPQQQRAEERILAEIQNYLAEGVNGS